MNPLTGSIKYLIASIYNSLVALVFDIILARYLTPRYLGEIALVQLIATLVVSVFAIMPNNLITREVSHDATAGKVIYVIAYHVDCSSSIYGLPSTARVH